MKKKTFDDNYYMKMAIRLAGKGIGKTSPNPMVGAVIVKDEKVIGRGYHKRCGDYHAEINAINNVKGSIRGSTLYITLDLVVFGQSKYIERTQDLEHIFIYTPSGDYVPLSTVADIQLGVGPEEIDHIERERSIIIQVIPPRTMPLERALDTIDMQIIKPMMEKGLLGGLYKANLAGTADKLQEARESLQWNFILAIGISYLLMAALFESFLYPIVIMFSVPLAAVGGFAGLAFLNLFTLQAMDVLTMLGFVILIGTVINNAILIVHQTLNNMRDGMESRLALIESVRTRIRPIFMSVVTTVFAMLPLVVFPGAGSELYRGLGSVVLGGLIVSTIFTLLLIPAVFSLVMDIKARVRHERAVPITISK